MAIDEKCLYFEIEKCTIRNIFLYFDIFDKLYLKTSLKLYGVRADLDSVGF